MKQYKIETTNNLYICNSLDEMLKKVTALKVVGAKYTMRAI